MLDHLGGKSGNFGLKSNGKVIIFRKFHSEIAGVPSEVLLFFRSERDGGRVTLLPGTELRPVSFNKRQKNEEAFFQKHSSRTHISTMFPRFPCVKHRFHGHFLLSRCKLCLRYTARNFNENPSVRDPANILRARASERSSNFCAQFEQLWRE